MPPRTGRGSMLRDKDREIALLHKIVEIIGSTWDLNLMLHQILNLVTEVTKADGCFLYVLEEGGADGAAELVLRASMNPHPREIGRIRLKLGEGVTGWVASQRKPVAIRRDACDDPRFKMFHSLPEDRYESFLSAPILMKEQVVGVINVHHKKAREHGSAVLNLLATIGRLVGAAVENARLASESRLKSQRIQTLEDDLETRKAVERAKGLLMRSRGLTEEDAFRELRTKSMSLRRSMRDVAQAVILASELPPLAAPIPRGS